MRALAVLLILLALPGAYGASEAPRDIMLMQGNEAGWQTVDVDDRGRVHAEFSYNDRNHGDHIAATWTVDSAGILTSYEAHGVDYMKAPVDERFATKAGRGTWKSLHENGESGIRGPAFYMPANPPPEMYGVLARALLKAPHQRLRLLPGGSVSLESAGHMNEWFLYRISGLDFMPVSVWLDHSGATVAFVSLWLSTVRVGHEAAVPALLAKQDEINRVWFERLANQLTHVPAADLIVRNARLFDPRDLTVTANSSVLIRGERVVRIAPDTDFATDSSAEIIDAKGGFLLPGLWDNHQHFDGVDGMLDIANGVTSGRDLANDLDVFPKRVARFDAGTEIGPRVLKAGVIDGTGPNAGPFTTLADTPEQALRYVDWYADHGYVQIKLYMSLKPQLVPIIADRAHERGLRVSGHVPAFMSAEQFIESGADELQHFNYVELNFLYPRVQETTLMSQRFLEVARHARELTPDQPQVRDFIAFLKRHHTVLDPTMGLLEDRLTGEPREVTPGLRSVAGRFPPQVRRNLMGGAYEVPKDSADAWREAIPSMLKLLKALHDAGVRIVPGTDALAGYMLHHELELYVRAGIPPAEVLRMATLTSAEVMGVDRDVGVIAPGKYADMLLVDGDPTKDISDIHHVVKVIKGGKVFDPRAIEQALSIAPLPSAASPR